MAATFTHSFTNLGIQPVFSAEAKCIDVALAPSQTLAKGTLLGEIIANDVYTVSTGVQASGTFTLSFGGATTTPIARTASAADVQNALIALATIGTGEVGVILAGTPGTSAVYTVTFANALGNVDNPPLTADFALLGTPANAALAQTTIGTSGVYKAYADGNTDGSQTAKAVCQFDCAVDSGGNITFGAQTGGGQHGQTSKSAPVFVKGVFKTTELVGLDANGLTDLGRLIQGVLSNGLLRIP